MPAPSSKLENLEKRSNVCRKLFLKDEQRLYKLYWEQCTTTYKKHMLAQEAIVMEGKNPALLGFSAKKCALSVKCVSFQKLLLKERQNLAKKEWELACCRTKKEVYKQAPES